MKRVFHSKPWSSLFPNKNQVQISQLSRDLTDSVVENENDKKNRMQTIQEYESRIRGMQEELTNQRNELLSMVEQKHELLESKIGVEKHEVGWGWSVGVLEKVLY